VGARADETPHDSRGRRRRPDRIRGRPAFLVVGRITWLS
jgi:hypothetical protein